MMASRHIGAALTATALFAAVGDLRAVPPETLTVGGTVQQASDGTSPTGAVWRVYGTVDSGEQLDGTVGDAVPGLWTGDIGSKIATMDVGTDYVAVLSKEVGGGTLSRTGYYAVVNHTLTGSDPAVFPSMTLRKIPVPEVTADTLARLTWDAAIEDFGDGGETNIVGYAVYRSPDWIDYALVGSTTADSLSFDDDIPNDGEYVYAVGLVYRGEPPITGAVLSARSPRVFKDSDGDGLPDYFKIANDLTIGSGHHNDGPEGDPDKDGMTNYEHWISGTRANDPTSYLFVKQPTPSGDGMLISWDGVAGRTYTVSRITDLTSNDWQVIHGPVSVTIDQPMSCTDSLDPAVRQRFYRVFVTKD